MSPVLIIVLQIWGLFVAWHPWEIKHKATKQYLAFSRESTLAHVASGRTSQGIAEEDLHIWHTSKVLIERNMKSGDAGDTVLVTSCGIELHTCCSLLSSVGVQLCLLGFKGS